MKKTLAILLFLYFSACGSKNSYESRAPQNLQEQAELDMEAGQSNSARYVAAEAKLKKVIASNAKNYPAISLLAASQAAQGGIVLVSVAVKIATQGTASAGSSSNPMSFFSGVFAAAKDDALLHIGDAIATYEKIPVAKLESEMTYQKSIFLAAYSYLLIKQIREHLASGVGITAEDVATLLTILATTQSVSGADSPIGKVITTLSTQITSAQGATAVEKITAWEAALP